MVIKTYSKISADTLMSCKRADGASIPVRVSKRGKWNFSLLPRTSGNIGTVLV